MHGPTAVQSVSITISLFSGSNNVPYWVYVSGLTDGQARSFFFLVRFKYVQTGRETARETQKQKQKQQVRPNRYSNSNPTPNPNSNPDTDRDPDPD